MISAKSTSFATLSRNDFLVDKNIILYYIILRKEETMKKISLNIPAEIEDHINFISEYLKRESMINFTKTQVILYAIEKLFSECWNESIKKDI